MCTRPLSWPPLAQISCTQQLSVMNMLEINFSGGHWLFWSNLSTPQLFKESLLFPEGTHSRYLDMADPSLCSPQVSLDTVPRPGPAEPLFLACKGLAQKWVEGPAHCLVLWDLEFYFVARAQGCWGHLISIKGARC